MTLPNELFIRSFVQLKLNDWNILCQTSTRFNFLIISIEYKRRIKLTRSIQTDSFNIKLTDIKLYGSLKEDRFKDMNFIKLLTSLTSLEFVWNDLSNDEWLNELSKLKYLKKLKLKNQYSPTENGKKYIGQLTNLQILILHCNEINNDFQEIIGGLVNLNQLCLFNSERKIDLKYFKSLTKLENLHCIHIEVESFQYLNYFNLTSLSIIHSDITNEDLKFIKTSSNIIYLDIQGSRVTSIENISHFAKLKTLNLTFVRITDDGLKSIHRLVNLEELILVQCKLITDTSIKYISENINLKYLHLMSCPNLTDESIQYLEKLTRLKYIDVEYTSLTDDGLKRAYGLIH